ncbi:MAG: leucine-rich repeat domain-containing protein, partial [Oscillospiraceae bacterium]|nr:leucine-rich repeat domain-containing protein [Oscillospiraceae bacterium]
YEALKNRGVNIGDDRKWIFSNACNFEYGMDPQKFLRVFRMIVRELDGEKVRGNMTFYNSYIGNLLSGESFEFILENFDRTGMNQMKILKMLVDKQAISCLEIAERYGWLKYPKKRDELIRYAADNGRVEAAAWLLEFKNRTADLAAEREKAEKKAERELNAAPDSVAALKRLWSYKKREDGMLSISKYKGNQTVVNVPEKIGKSIVTNIESGVLACSNVPRISAEQTAIRKKITKIILPKTLRSIGYYAFLKLESLEEINLPEGLNGITTGAFKNCRSLKSITIPGSAKKIGDSAFSGCSSLKNVVIEEGVEEIGEHAFEDCGELESIDFPKSVGLIVNINKNGIVNGAFPKLTAKVFKGSCAEQY